MANKPTLKVVGAAEAQVSGSEGENQTYLRVAELVLTSALTPLKAREIVDRGIERGYFGDHPLSRTPEKSMQARLSVDILNKGTKSKFVRTTRGRFTLWSKINSDSALDHGSNQSAATLTHYIAEKRVLRTPTEQVLCTSESAFRDVLTFQGIDVDMARILRPLLSDDAITYVPRTDAEARDDAKQFITYVLVQCGQRLLYFRRSYLSRAAEFLRGSKCVGFGGHVTAADDDMLARGDKGLETYARRELVEELYLPTEARGGLQQTRRATVRLFQDVSLEPLGVLNDDSSEVGRRHVAVVYRAWLSDWDAAKRLQKGDSSIKGLGWLDLSKDKIDISEFEYWSQLCLRKFYPSTATSRAGYKIHHKAGFSSHRAIVVAGRIGSGKSETATYLSQRLALPLLKTGDLLRELMRCPPISEIGRSEFQERAFAFIQSPGGPQQLATHIGIIAEPPP